MDDAAVGHVTTPTILLQERENLVEILHNTEFTNLGEGLAHFVKDRVAMQYV